MALPAGGQREPQQVGRDQEALDQADQRRGATHAQVGAIHHIHEEDREGGRRQHGEQGQQAVPRVRDSSSAATGKAANAVKAAMPCTSSEVDG